MVFVKSLKGIRRILVVVLLISCCALLPFLTFICTKNAQRRAAIAELESAGGVVWRSWELKTDGGIMDQAATHAPSYLDRWSIMIGDDPLYSVGGLRLSRTGTDRLLRKHLSEMRELRILDLRNSDVSDATIKREVAVQDSKIEIIRLDNTAVTDDSVHALSSLPRLNRIDLNGCRITDAGIKSLQYHPTLAQLRIENTKVPIGGVVNLQRTIPGLDIIDTLDSLVKALHAKHGDFTAACGAIGVSSRKNANGEFSHLSFRFVAHFTDAGLQRLVEWNSLPSLDLAYTEVTDVGVETLKRSSKLQVIDLSDTVITNESLRTLANLPQLESLIIRNTNVTEEGITEFRKARPGVSIVAE